MKRLYVGNMSFDTTESDLRSLFEPFGELGEVHVATDRATGRSRGFAFVEMADDEAASKAIAALDGKSVGGRALKVNEARPRPQGNFGGGRGGGGGGRSRDDFRGPSRRREPRW